MPLAAIKDIIGTLRELMTPPEAPKRPIGFVIDSKPDKKVENKSKAAGRSKKK